MITKEEFDNAVIVVEKYLIQIGLDASIRPPIPKTVTELKAGDFIRCIHVGGQSKKTYTEGKLYATDRDGYPPFIKNDRGQTRAIRGKMLVNFEIV